MVNNIAKLSRLSRNKVTGNIIIFLLAIVCIAFFLGTIGRGLSSDSDKIAIFTTFILTMLIAYIIDKQLRKPFFNEISRYLAELMERRFDIEQTTIQLEFINPFQPISSLRDVLKQIDDLYTEMENLYIKSSNEISIKASPMRITRIQRELNSIIRSSRQSLEDIKNKRNHIVFLANVRHRIINTINEHISRPRNKIESDYLLFKVQKHIKNHTVDEHLFQEILSHILSQGEVIGRLEQNNSGEQFLAIESSNETETIRDISWEESERYQKQCVICRYPIQSDSESIECPHCHNTFHRNHLLEWLKVFNQCPMCQQRLTMFSNQP